MVIQWYEYLGEYKDIPRIKHVSRAEWKKWSLKYWWSYPKIPRVLIGLRKRKALKNTVSC